MKRIYQRIFSDKIREKIFNFRVQYKEIVSLSIEKIFTPNIRNYEQRLKMFENKYHGKRCFIMGNGPSLNQMDLSLFSDEYVWCSNRAYLLFERINWRPAFYVSVDKRVVPDIRDELDSLALELDSTHFFYPLEFRAKRVLRNNANVYWFKELDLDEDNKPYGMFSADIAQNVRKVRTVTVTALQLAVYMGFNPIYLIGCDTNYTIPTDVTFEQDDPEKLTSTKDNDLNHFDSRYFGTGKKWHNPHVERMIEHYKQVKIIADEKGIEIYNATIGGKLEVFPRVDYLDLFD